jgi:hypothetical protein
MVSLHLPHSALIPRGRGHRWRSLARTHHCHHPTFPPPQLPTHIRSIIMSSDGRSRRRELVEEAYNLQVKAGLMASRIPFGYYDC